MEHVICDVLVVGGGGAALRAAIAAKEKEPAATVVVVTKGKLGHSGVTATACSDRMAFHATLAQTEPKGPDNWLYHAEDIHKIGGQVSDWNLAEILARESAAAFDYLDRLGVPFVRMGGRVLQFVTDGSVYPRACYTGPRTAVHIEEAIVKRLGNLDIKVIEHAMVAKLLKNKDRVCGALVLDAREKDSVRRGLLEVQAKTIVLATGGGGLIYRHNVFPVGMSGDGYALAYEAGAELVNMEFVQLGLASVRTKLNCSGSMLRAVPRLVDENGREILDDYLPPGTDRANLADIVFRKGGSWPVSFEHDTHLLDIAVYKEVQHGHRVYLDYNVNPAGFDFSQLPTADQERYKEEIVEDFGSEARKASPLARLREINPASIEWLREHGIDLALGDLVEIACCGQHFEGGVKIGSKGETTVPGLYAAGEVAGGQHGANRPGGNALLDGQVFGRIAGESAVLEALGTPITFVAEAELQEDIARWEALRGEGGVPARDYRRRIQEIVEAAAGVVRTEDGLRQGLCNLSKLAEEHACLAGWPVAQGLENSYMLIVAEMVLQAALMRDESRGHHLRFVSERDSMPVGRRDPEWQQYLVIFRDGQEMRLEKRTPC